MAHLRCSLMHVYIVEMLGPYITIAFFALSLHHYDIVYEYDNGISLYVSVWFAMGEKNLWLADLIKCY